MKFFIKPSSVDMSLQVFLVAPRPADFAVALVEASDCNASSTVVLSSVPMKKISLRLRDQREPAPEHSCQDCYVAFSL